MHISQPNRKSMGMLSQVGNPSGFIKLWNLMKRFGTPFYGVDQLTGNQYALEANSMTFIQEDTTIMPHVSSTIGTCPVDPSQALSPPLGVATKLTPPVAGSSQVQQAVVPGPADENEERGATG